MNSYFLAVTASTFFFSATPDPITDQPKVSALLIDGQNALKIGCNKPGAENLYSTFTSSEFLGGRGSRAERRSITIRYGASAPSTISAVYLNNRAEIYGGDTLDMIKGLIGSEVVTARLLRYDGRQTDLTFRYTEAHKALREVFRACVPSAPVK